MKLRYRETIMSMMVVLIIGCDSKIDYVEYQLPQKNPMSYEFPFSLDTVRNAVSSWLNKRYASIYTSQDTIIFQDEEFMRLPENKNDFFVDVPISATASLYRRKDTGEPMRYYGVVHIHITQTERNKTVVEVRTINPRIFTGVEFPANVITDFHGGVITKKVSPSTVEEYALLLKFGEVLGMRHKMPPLVDPVPPKEEK